MIEAVALALAATGILGSLDKAGCLVLSLSPDPDVLVFGAAQTLRF